MTPIVLASFCRGGCVAKKNRLSQYIPVIVIFLRDVTSLQRRDLIIMAELRLRVYTSLRLEKTLTSSKIEFPYVNKMLIIMGS